MKETTAIIDIGSSSIVTLIGECGVNDTFKILGKGEVSYAGFQNAEFLEPDSLKYAIAQSISNAEITSELKISSVHVGVPGEFSSCVTKSVNLTFPRTKRISKFDIDNIFKTGNTFDDDPKFVLYNHSVIFYELDSSRRVIEPLNEKAKSITGQISYILAEKNFIAFLKSIFKDLKIEIAGFISSTLAECLYLFENSVRDRYALLVDVGYITTTVALSRGNALLYISSFSLGGGYITSDLSQCLKISFNEAERLKHKIVLGWNPKDNDTYEVEGDEIIGSYSAKATNDIASDRVEMICEYINKCLDHCKYDLPEFLPVYFVGGGFNFIKGIKTIISRKLKRRIEFINTIKNREIRPYDASEEGLLNMILNYNYLLEDLIVKV